MEEKFMFRQVAVLYYTGHIVYAIAIHTKVKHCSYSYSCIHALRYANCNFQSACAPNFSNFPWGVQVCSLKFGSWINSQYNVEYRY